MLTLTNCASFPKSAAITQFSQATTTATTLLQNAGKLDLQLSQKLGYEEAVTEYINGQSFKFPPGDFALLDKKRISARLQVLGAISSYADALAALDDPQQPAKVGTAISGLGSVVTNFSKVANPNANTAEIAPVVNLLGASVTFFVSQQNAIAIRNAVKVADPWIKQAASLLIADFSILNRRYTRRLTELRALQKQKIRYVRRDSKVTRIDLENRFSELYTADQDLSTQVTALQQSTNILNALVAAHDELANSEGTDREIADFKTLVDAIAVDIPQIKNAPKK
jgi:hypothetical protein